MSAAKLLSFRKKKKTITGIKSVSRFYLIHCWLVDMKQENMNTYTLVTSVNVFLDHVASLSRVCLYHL